MFVVTVEFVIAPAHRDEFRVAMNHQAATSFADEPGCHQFDVAVSPDDENVIFLYELYADEGAFQVHLESAHFKAFDATVAPWVTSKTVKTYHRVWPDDA